MDYKKIIVVSGKSGLFEVLGQSKTAFIVKSLVDGKKMPVYTSNRTTTLEDIVVFTETGEVKLTDILQKIYKHTDGKEAISYKSAENELVTYFESIVPDYDKNKVYTSDIKKIIFWYNLLHENNLLDFTEEKVEEESKEEK